MLLNNISRSEDIRLALRLTYITLGWMTIEGAASLLLGWASKSLLLEAFGIDSLIELFSGAVLFWRFPVAVFVSGYITIWSAFSVAAALSQWLLHRHALLSTSMASTSTILGGILLLAAGAFQFTPLKNSCLTHCRGPMEFIMTRWRDGWLGAFAMGLEHGAFCTGCCWALMILLFVAGVMNLLWIAALTISS